MHFQFNSLQDFISMGGHGFYVWITYTIVFTGLLAVSLLPTVRRKNFIAEQRALACRIQQQQDYDG